jgi:hypothetical protein
MFVWHNLQLLVEDVRPPPEIKRHTYTYYVGKTQHSSTVVGSFLASLTFMHLRPKYGKWTAQGTNRHAAWAVIGPSFDGAIVRSFDAIKANFLVIGWLFQRAADFYRMSNSQPQLLSIVFQKYGSIGDSYPVKPGFWGTPCYARHVISEDSCVVVVGAWLSTGFVGLLYADNDLSPISRRLSYIYSRSLVDLPRSVHLAKKSISCKPISRSTK